VTEASNNAGSSSFSDFEALGAAQITRSSSYGLKSAKIDQEFLIDVALPSRPVPAGQKLPVVFVLDGNANFGLAASTSRLLQAGPYPLPPTIVVGIGYRAKTPEDEARNIHLRVRDLTPSVDQSVEARYRTAPAPWTLPPDIKQGGAAAFAAFVEEELKPFIASRYPVDLDDATLVGMSLGGLFVLHTLFTAPHTFKRYIAASPGLYWDERKVFDIEAAQAATIKDLPVHLFLSAGGLEENMDADCRFVSSVYELEARLRRRAYPNLAMHFHVFPEETHMSVFPAALSRGLTTVFGGHRDIYDWAKRLKE
jgi:predicted alpha/beta superfamily hydrolase